MKELLLFIKNLANLIKVKTAVTFIVMIIFAILALRGGEVPNNVMQVVTMVIAFYFGTQLDKKG